VRAGWDSDNVLAPIITAAGDMVTLPALFLATLVIELDRLTPPLAVLLSVLSIAVPVAALRSTLTLLRRILVESFPVVVAAGVLQLVAGLTIESRLASFTALPALLVLVPPFLAAAGALGGLLSSRLSSALHLGLMAPTGLPRGPARVSIALVLVLAVPLFTLCSVVADAGSAVTGLASPGALRLLGVTVVGGAVATGFVVLVAYYGTIVAVRLGLDPDTYGIPVVTASVDLVGAFALVLGILAVGVG
jgi:mgtE-like transporter